MTAPVKVTVVIPVYNREKYVGEAIKSILARTFPTSNPWWSMMRH